MSYAIRNTIILLVALILLMGSGHLYFSYIQAPKIESLNATIQTDERQLTEKQSIAEQLPLVQQEYDNALEFIQNFDKTLFRTNNPDQVYRFLSLLASTDPLIFDFAFSDSTQADQYGVIRSQVTGSGHYRAVTNFISRIEYSQPVQKVNNISITPDGAESGYNNVNFTFNLNSYFDRLNQLDAPEIPDVSGRIAISQHNPFFPLIRDIEPNEENLTDVENSRLAGISAGMVYLINQNGRMVTLRENDRVYLGRLETIDINAGKVTFRLNKGGIIEMVTMEVQR